MFCSSDTLAQGALSEAARAGCRCRGQLAVMGFGDLNFAAHTYPALSTVRIGGRPSAAPLPSACSRASTGREVGERIIDLGFEVIQRDSAPEAGPLRARCCSALPETL
ncbi:substrate-binding domain-containing protein [Cupriavidus basilensis]